MGSINYSRLIAGAVVAGIFYFIADGVIHGVILALDHTAAITGAGKPLQHDPAAYVYFAVFDLGKGLVALLFYVAARARYGPGVRTAVGAGLVAWLAVEVLPAVASMPFPFYDKPYYVKVIVLEIVPMVIGAILGAWVYREAASK